MTEYVLDASALLTIIHKEKGADEVEAALPMSVMSAVNVAEAVRVLGRSFSYLEAENIISLLVSEIIPFDKVQAFLTGSIGLIAKANGLSLGDCACLSLAKHRNIPVLTADRIWKRIEKELQVEVQLIR